MSPHLQKSVYILVVDSIDILSTFVSWSQGLFHVWIFVAKSSVCGPGGEKCQLSTVSRGFRAVTKLLTMLRPQPTQPQFRAGWRVAGCGGQNQKVGFMMMERGRWEVIQSTVTGGDKPVCIISLGARPVFTLFKLWPSADMYVSEVWCSVWCSSTILQRRPLLAPSPCRKHLLGFSTSRIF